MFTDSTLSRSFKKVDDIFPHKFLILTAVSVFLSFNVALAAEEVADSDSEKEIASKQEIPKSLQRKARRKNNAEIIFVKTEDTVEPKVEELPEETAALLESIPAGGMPDVEPKLEIRHSVDIERGEQAQDPFQQYGNVEPEEEIEPGDVGLHLSIRERDTSDSEYLKTAHDALKAGMTESAVAYYKKVLMNDQSNEKAMFGLATTYHQSGQYDEARNMYIELISANQNNWPALNNFLVLASQEAPNDALKQLKRLEESNPEFAAIPAQMSMIYMKQNKLKEATRSLGRAVSLDPTNLQYQYDLAILLEHVGHNDIAAKLYNKILRTAREEGLKLPAPYLKIHERAAFLAAK